MVDDGVDYCEAHGCPCQVAPSPDAPGRPKWVCVDCGNESSNPECRSCGGRMFPPRDAPGLREAALLELLYHATTRRHEFTETCASCSAIRAALVAPSPDAPRLRDLDVYECDDGHEQHYRVADVRAALAAQSEETP